MLQMNLRGESAVPKGPRLLQAKLPKIGFRLPQKGPTAVLSLRSDNYRELVSFTVPK